MVKNFTIYDWTNQHFCEKITQEVFNQVYRYNTVLRVKYLTVCNGRQLFCCRVDYDANKAVFLKDVPCYDDL